MHSEMAVIFNVVFSVLRWSVPREHPYDRSLHISQQCKRPLSLRLILMQFPPRQLLLIWQASLHPYVSRYPHTP